MPNLVQTTRALLEEMSKPQTEAKDTPVDKVHFCATHVEHALYGAGTCISEAHAEPDAEGNIAWYTVQFPDGVRKVDTAEMKITMGESHGHSKKKPMKEEEEQIEEVEQVEEAQTSAAAKYVKAKAKMSHQASTTMKHVANPTAGEMKAAKDIKPGVAGYKDRVAMLQSAKARGALKNEAAEQVDEKLHPNQQKLDMHEPEKDKLTAKDFAMLRKSKMRMKEDVETMDIEVVLEGIVPIKIPAKPTYEHYINAINYIINDDSEEVQKEVIALATEAYKNNEIDVLVRAQYMFAMDEATSVKMPTATGMRVMGHRYGDSASATRNQTKKSVDVMSGPSKKDMDKLAKAKK